MDCWTFLITTRNQMRFKCIGIVEIEQFDGLLELAVVFVFMQNSEKALWFIDTFFLGLILLMCYFLMNALQFTRKQKCSVIPHTFYQFHTFFFLTLSLSTIQTFLSLQFPYKEQSVCVCVCDFIFSWIFMWMCVWVLLLHLFSLFNLHTAYIKCVRLNWLWQ